MAVQESLNIDTTPFVLDGVNPREVYTAVIKQDVGRSTLLVKYTLMAQIATAGADQDKWVPLTNLAATDGTAIPRGIYMGDDIAAADLVAGDVVDSRILIADAGFDVNKLVIENSLTLGSVYGTGIFTETVRSLLSRVDLYPKTGRAISRFEN